MSRSTLPTVNKQPAQEGVWGNALEGESTIPCFPTETEIYLLPDGSVVIADMPAELAAAFAVLGSVEPCALPPQP